MAKVLKEIHNQKKKTKKQTPLPDESAPPERRGPTLAAGQQHPRRLILSKLDSVRIAAW